MTFFHLVNCLALAFAPYVIAFKYSVLSEYSSIWQCLQAAGIYFATQFIKLLTYATFFPAPEAYTQSVLQYILGNVAEIYDIAGLWLTINFLHGRGEIRFLITGFSWAFSHALSTHLIPLIIGARKSAFSWVYVQRGLESNLDLVFFVGMAALVWLGKSTKRNGSIAFANQLAWVWLSVALARNSLFGILENVLGFHSWTLLLVKSAYTLFIGSMAFTTYLQFTQAITQVQNNNKVY